MIKSRKLFKAGAYCLAIVGVVAYLVAGARAEVVLDYTGGDPAAVGWSLTASGACTGILVDDAGTPALQIVDPTTAGGQVWSYGWDSALTSSQFQEVSDVGFSLSATLRVEDMIADGYDETYSLAPGMQAGLKDLRVWYLLCLGQNANGDTTYSIKASNASTWTEASTGTLSGNGYHTYKLLYSSVEGSADLLIDGNEVASNIVSNSNPIVTLGNRVHWGAEDSGGMGTGYWTNVAFETAPAELVVTPLTGHQILLDKGLQLESLVMPTYVVNNGGTFNLDLYRESGFTTMNLWNPPQTYDALTYANILPSGSDAFDFSKLVGSSTDPGVCSTTYMPNLVRIQLGDEQSIISNSSYPDHLTDMAAEVAALKAKYPTAMIYTNQSPLYHEDPSGTYNVTLTPAILDTYIQTVQPDMLSFTEYPFRWQGTSYYNYYGGSPKYMYDHIELYRNAGLAGLTGDGSQPIPVSMFVQTFAHISSYTNGRQPTESEFRLQQFVGWASGMKMISSFLYCNLPPELDSMFFEGTDVTNQTPTTQFYQYKELNRQSSNLGDALVQLISTDLFLKRGSYYKTSTGTVVTNAATSVTDWSVSASDDPYLTDISVTNLGTCNTGLAGDVVVGYLKPLDASLVADGCEDDMYFMIVNGLTDGAALLASDCSQLINLTFDFGDSGIDSLLRMSRDTGTVEKVSLTHVSGTIYTLDLTLEGGTGDLFKYNTGSAFISSSLPGDANGDGRVDGSDVTILAGNWQYGVTGGGATWSMGDFNGDGKVDGSDVTILAGNWQAGVTSAASAVPEPSCLVLLLSIIILLAAEPGRRLKF